MKAICIGHSTFDTTLPMTEYPTENNKYRIPYHVECGGGSGPNGAYVLAKWGVDTTIVSALGNDYQADRIIDEFKSVGANVDYLQKIPTHKTSCSYIFANMENGSRTIITSKAKAIRKLDIKEKLQQADVILIDGEHPETAKKILKDNPTAISVFDVSRVNDDNLELGKLVTYLVCSHEFAEKFANTKINYKDLSTIKFCYDKLKEYFQTNIIITLESSGSFTEIDGKCMQVPSIKVKAIDSTGAGDIFHGAFAYFISNGYSLIDAIHYASVTGALSVETIGARYSVPELKEVLEYDNII